MHTETIDKLFDEVIRRRGIHRIAGRSLDSVLQLRYRLGKGQKISLETKIFFLQKAGIRLEQLRWSDQDLLSFLRFYNNTSEAARKFGPEYVLEKWKNKA